MADNAWDATKDVDRSIRAARKVIDGRKAGDEAGVMVTLEHTVTAVLLTLYGGDPRMAAGMLNEGLVPGIEKRLADYDAHRKKNDHADRD